MALRWSPDYWKGLAPSALVPILKPTIPTRPTATNSSRSGKQYSSTQASQPSRSFRAHPAPCNPASEACKRASSNRSSDSYDLRFPKPIFLKYPLSALVVRQLCEVFDTKLIYVMRPLDDIERTRLRRNWLPYFGAEGAAVIYNHMSAALKDHPYPTMSIEYAHFLASPMVHACNIARFAGLNPSPAELQHAVDIVRKQDAIQPAFNEKQPDEMPQTAAGSEVEESFVDLYNDRYQRRSEPS